MDIFVQQIINGLVLGSMYALVALGYKPPEVTRLLQKVDPSVAGTEELIRHALRAAAS